MASKFSPAGSLLAFHRTTYMRSNHEIVIMKVNSLQVSHVLVGHFSIVYDIDWLSEDTLISVSSDRTAIIWFLTKNSFKIRVIYHKFTREKLNYFVKMAINVNNNLI